MGIRDKIKEKYQRIKAENERIREEKRQLKQELMQIENEEYAKALAQRRAMKRNKAINAARTKGRERAMPVAQRISLQAENASKELNRLLGSGSKRSTGGHYQNKNKYVVVKGKAYPVANKSKKKPKKKKKSNFDLDLSIPTGMF